MKIALHFLIQRRAAANKIANATTHAFVNRIEQNLAKIQRRLVAQPGIEPHQQICGLANPLISFVQAILDASMEQLPKRRHAHHSRDVAILNCLGQMFTAKFRQISDLRAATKRRQKSG